MAFLAQAVGACGLWNGDCEATLPALRSVEKAITDTVTIDRLSQGYQEGPTRSEDTDNEGIEDPDPKITLT